MELRRAWDGMNSDNEYNVTVYLGRVLYAILSVEGVSSAYELKLNNTETDVRLTENKTTQELPTLGTVTLSEQ